MVGGVESLVRFVERLSDEPGLWPGLLADPLGTAVAAGVAVDAQDVKGLLGIAGATDAELVGVIEAHLKRLEPDVARGLLDGCVRYLFPGGLPAEPRRPGLRQQTELPLGARLEAGLTRPQVAALERLERFDLTPIATYLAAEGTLPPSWLEDAIYEFRRYLGLRRVFACSLPMFSDQVDQVWHTCLLFTELYAELCREVFGYFTHHDPWDEPKPDRVPALWQRFSAAYGQVYGPPGYLWTLRLPAAARGIEVGGEGIEAGRLVDDPVGRGPGARLARGRTGVARREEERGMSSEAARLPLGVVPGVALSAAQLRALRALEAVDLGPVRHRIKTKALLPATDIDEALREFRRYLGLQALGAPPLAMFSQTVDVVWHTCLTFTRRYAELCESAFGRFIHHQPIVGHEYGAPEAAADARARFAAFRADYERRYGPISAPWLRGRPWAAR